MDLDVSPTGRPPLGKPEVGDEVFVREGGGRHTTTTAARITAVGRVWVTMQAVGSGREWRLRRDSQNDGRGIGYSTNFATPEQLAYDKKASAAHAYLRDQGIEVRYHSPWSGNDGAIALAALLRKADEGNP